MLYFDVVNLYNKQLKINETRKENILIRIYDLKVIFPLLRKISLIYFSVKNNEFKVNSSPIINKKNINLIILISKKH